MKALLRTLAVSSLMLLVAACSSGEEKQVFPTVVTVQSNTPITQALGSELVVGENRFPYFILDKDGFPVVDAKTTITFYDLNDGQEVKKDSFQGMSVVPARDAGLDEQIIHIHADGTRHPHGNASDQIGLYVVNVNFDRPGLWGAVVEVEGGTPPLSATLQMRFDVLEEGTIPNIGEPAPSAVNLTAADVDDLALIDTSAEPSTEMHEMTIADAIVSGEPTLVLFAAPGYCATFMCGPSYEIMRKLYEKYETQPVNFIHVEFYDDPAGKKTPVQAALDWRLPSEPWFFVIDDAGMITARFEGPTSYYELDEALKQVVTP